MPIIAGVERTSEPKVPPTSVRSGPSTTKSCELSIPASSESPMGRGTIHSSPVSHRVCIVGGTGALGYGLALRLGRADVPILIGSRDAGRAQEAADRARQAVPSGSFEAGQNEEAVREAEIVI